MKVAFVGSRKRRDRDTVEGYVRAVSQKYPEFIFISGGCKGVDTWAEQEARKLGHTCIIHKPDWTGNPSDYYEICRRYYDRNRLIAKDADVIVAFPSSDRKGGTENTIKHAYEFGKQIIIK